MAEECGWIMGEHLTTAVVEARLLVREALKSLMAANSYRVVCAVGRIAEIDTAAISAEPKFVILGAQSADSTIAEAAAIRKLWPDSKIILLYEYGFLDDFQKLLTSQINGCVPTFASSDALISTLEMIVTEGIRVVIAPDTEPPPMQPASRTIQPAEPDEPHQAEIRVETLQSDGPERRFALSQREIHILEGLVKGHANKVIARTCGIAEATVKVHVKTILRKIGVGNRTQAAVWALGNGYTLSECERRPMLTSDRPTAAVATAAITSAPLNCAGAGGVQP